MTDSISVQAELCSMSHCSNENVYPYLFSQGVELMKRVLTNVKPCFSGPAGTIPSRLHANTVESMIKHLRKMARLDKTTPPDGAKASNNDHRIAKHKNRKFSLFNEFSGLRGVFPVDAGFLFLLPCLVIFFLIYRNFILSKRHLIYI